MSLREPTSALSARHHTVMHGGPTSRDPFLFLHFTICAFILSLLLLESTASSYRADLRGEITLNDCESLF